MSTQLDASLADQVKKVIAKFEASLIDQVKDEVRKEFHSYLWSWSLPIQKRVVWPVMRLVHERRCDIARLRLVLLISLWSLIQNLQSS